MNRSILVMVVLSLICISGMSSGQEFSMVYDGTTRTYVVYNPTEGSTLGNRPLVIGLHGTGANGVKFLATASLVRKADDEGFIVACPNALQFENYTYFNAGGSFEDLTGGVDDVGFISAVIDTMIANYDVDPSRVYVMGFSNGSAMAYRVAAQLSDKVAAIGAVSGQMVYEYCDPDYPVPIIHFHGLSDRFIPYEGRGENIPSVESALDIWRDINSCSPDSQIIYDADGILGRKWESSTGNDIILYTIEDMEHEWPREASLKIQATDVIWTFISQYSR